MFIDTRCRISFEDVNRLLLRVAERPLDHAEVRHPGPPSDLEVAAAQLARQASASVICNCASEAWSALVEFLHALEPEFPLYPKRVDEFVKETRLPWLSVMSLYYHMCKVPFEGHASCQKMKTILDLRNDLVHDKPETHSGDHGKRRTDTAEKWFKRLVGFVGEEGLHWLPPVRRDGTKRPSPLLLGGEPVITMFMKWPVAKWAFEASREVIEEMSQMMLAYTGKKKLDDTAAERREERDERHTSNAVGIIYERLWACGE